MVGPGRGGGRLGRGSGRAGERLAGSPAGADPRAGLRSCQPRTSTRGRDGAEQRMDRVHLERRTGRRVPDAGGRRAGAAAGGRSDSGGVGGRRAHPRRCRSLRGGWLCDARTRPLLARRTTAAARVRARRGGQGVLRHAGAGRRDGSLSARRGPGATAARERSRGQRDTRRIALSGTTAGPLSRRRARRVHAPARGSRVRRAGGIDRLLPRRRSLGAAGLRGARAHRGDPVLRRPPRAPSGSRPSNARCSGSTARRTSA